MRHLFVWVRRTEGVIQPIGELAMTAPDRKGETAAQEGVKVGCSAESARVWRRF